MPLGYVGCVPLAPHVIYGVLGLGGGFSVFQPPTCSSIVLVSDLPLVACHVAALSAYPWGSLFVPLYPVIPCHFLARTCFVSVPYATSAGRTSVVAVYLVNPRLLPRHPFPAFSRFLLTITPACSRLSFPCLFPLWRGCLRLFSPRFFPGYCVLCSTPLLVGVALCFADLMLSLVGAFEFFCSSIDTYLSGWGCALRGVAARCFASPCSLPPLFVACLLCCGPLSAGVRCALPPGALLHACVSRPSVCSLGAIFPWSSWSSGLCSLVPACRSVSSLLA